MDLLQTRSIVLLVATALGYAVATVGMKITAGNGGLDGPILLLLGFIAATVAEVALLRGASLGAIYLLIIAAESLLVLAYAWYIGEGLTREQLAGGALIFVGVAVLAH